MVRWGNNVKFWNIIFMLCFLGGICLFVVFFYLFRFIVFFEIGISLVNVCKMVVLL